MHNHESIDQIQNTLIQDFACFQGDPEAMLLYLIELGAQLPLLPNHYRSDAHLLQGCLSRVWLAHTYQQGVMRFYVDSDTTITKGLASLLITIWQDRPVQDIMTSRLYFFEKTGLAKLIGTQRTSGLALMQCKMKDWAKYYI